MLVCRTCSRRPSLTLLNMPYKAARKLAREQSKPCDMSQLCMELRALAEIEAWGDGRVRGRRGGVLCIVGSKACFHESILVGGGSPALPRRRWANESSQSKAQLNNRIYFRKCVLCRSTDSFCASSDCCLETILPSTRPRKPFLRPRPSIPSFS